MEKYKELDNPSSCLSRALPSERIFVLLERDIAAPETIRFWCRQRIVLGKNTADDPQMHEAIACARAMEETQKPQRALRAVVDEISQRLECAKTSKSTSYEPGSITFHTGRVDAYTSVLAYVKELLDETVSITP